MYTSELILFLALPADSFGLLCPVWIDYRWKPFKLERRYPGSFILAVISAAGLAMHRPVRHQELFEVVSGSREGGGGGRLGRIQLVQECLRIELPRQDAFGAVAEIMDHFPYVTLVVITHHHETTAIQLDGGAITPECAFSDHATFIKAKIWPSEHPDFVDLLAFYLRQDIEILDDALVIGKHVAAV